MKRYSTRGTREKPSAYLASLYVGYVTLGMHDPAALIARYGEFAGLQLFIAHGAVLIHASGLGAYHIRLISSSCLSAA